MEGGLLHFIKIMQWERWISERVHVHERKSSANILLKLDGSSVLCYLVCPSGQAERQRRNFFFFFLESCSFVDAPGWWRKVISQWLFFQIMHSLTRSHSCLSTGIHQFSFTVPLLLPGVWHTDKTTLHSGRYHSVPALGVPGKEQISVGTDCTEGTWKSTLCPGCLQSAPSHCGAILEGKQIPFLLAPTTSKNQSNFVILAGFWLLINSILVYNINFEHFGTCLILQDEYCSITPEIQGANATGKWA